MSEKNLSDLSADYVALRARIDADPEQATDQDRAVLAAIDAEYADALADFLPPKTV